MIKIKVKTPTVKIPKLLTRQIMLGAGTLIVNNYKQRLNRGMGVSESGNIVKLQKLSEITKKNKGSNIPLIDTARMASAFRVDPALTTEKRAVFNFPQSESWKAGIHQKGVTIKPKKKGGRLCVPFGDKFLFLKSVTIPARRHVGFSKKDISDALKYINYKTSKQLEEGTKIGKAR
jgi:phage gpG-like protein